MARKKTAKKAPRARRSPPRAKITATKIVPPPPPPPINEQIKQVFEKLQPRHPNLVGIGVGYRRCGPREAIQPVMTVRFIVKKKPKQGKPLPKGARRLPKTVSLRAVALGQTVTVRVPTDVEAAPKTAVSSGFRIHTVRAASFITWRDAGLVKSGALTAAHAFDATGEVVFFEGNTTDNPQATVRALSDWKNNGIDGAVAEIDRADVRLQDTGPTLAAPPATIEQIIAAIGDAKDELNCTARFWGFSDEPEITAVAYYAKYPMNYMDGSTVTLTDVIECVPRSGVFRKGQSGALWSGQLTPGVESPLAIQSHMVSGGKRAFGCICATVADTVRQLLADPAATLVFTVDEVRAVV